MSYIAKNIKYLLTNEGISEHELSRRIGIHQQVLNRLILGINLNPTLATISPISKYFKVPLDELIYEDLATTSKLISFKVPFFNFNDLQKHGIQNAIDITDQFISLESKENKNFFATEMVDDSMEPKFPIGSILIFDKDKTPSNGDFCLLGSDENTFLFRQVFFNSLGKKYFKCLNPQYNEFNLLQIPINLYVLATLLESRTNF